MNLLVVDVHVAAAVAIEMLAIKILSIFCFKGFCWHFYNNAMQFVKECIHKNQLRKALKKTIRLPREHSWLLKRESE